MKANSGFVIGMLALCGVSSVDEVKAEQINADHVRLMHNCLTTEARSLFSDLCGDADDACVDNVIMTNDPRFIHSGLGSANVAERVLVELIFMSQGRQICFGQMRLVVSPSEKKIAEKKRADARARLATEGAHCVAELKGQPA